MQKLHCNKIWAGCVLGSLEKLYAGVLQQIACVKIAEKFTLAVTLADFSSGSIVIVLSGKRWSYSKTLRNQDQMHNKINSRMIKHGTDKYTPHKRRDTLLLLLQLYVCAPGMHITLVAAQPVLDHSARRF